MVQIDQPRPEIAKAVLDSFWDLAEFNNDKRINAVEVLLSDKVFVWLFFVVNLVESRTASRKTAVVIK